MSYSLHLEQCGGKPVMRSLYALDMDVEIIVKKHVPVDNVSSLNI